MIYYMFCQTIHANDSQRSHHRENPLPDIDSNYLMKKRSSAALLIMWLTPILQYSRHIFCVTKTCSAANIYALNFISAAKECRKDASRIWLSRSLIAIDSDVLTCLPSGERVGVYNENGPTAALAGCKIYLQRVACVRLNSRRVHINFYIPARSAWLMRLTQTRLRCKKKPCISIDIANNANVAINHIHTIKFRRDYLPIQLEKCKIYLIEKWASST